MSEALKPCPFCGGTPTLSETRSNGYREIGCIPCDVWTSSSFDDSCVEVWNRRSEPVAGQSEGTREQTHGADVPASKEDQALSRPAASATAPFPNQEIKELCEKVAAALPPTEQEIIDGGVGFIMGPRGDEGTRSATAQIPEEPKTYEGYDGIWLIKTVRKSDYDALRAHAKSLEQAGATLLMANAANKLRAEKAECELVEARMEVSKWRGIANHESMTANCLKEKIDSARKDNP